MHYVISVLQPYTCKYSTAPTKDAFCLCCSEVEGARGMNELGTCLLEHVCILPAAPTELSLYSDTCGVQNINQNVSVIFIYVVQNTAVEVVTHNFLESGHLHMGCDSMYAAIEQTESRTLHKS